MSTSLEEKNIVVLSESSYDYKYKKILSEMEGLLVLEVGFLKLIKLLATRNCFYHIRYIKYRGKIFTILRILLVTCFSKVSGSKIIWTCHNIYEHNISSKRYNDFLRKILAQISYRIIVFHPDMKCYLPRFSRQKVFVASFGNYREFIDQQTEQNKEFQRLYRNWLGIQGIYYPDLISISSAKRNRIEYFLPHIEEDYKLLVVAPNVTFNSMPDRNNLFIYTDSSVKAEIKDILTKSHDVIGLIGHDNISVPTSIYMYASYRIPVIVLNYQPVNSIVSEWKIGEVFDESKALRNLIQMIRDNYGYYQDNCDLFLESMSWDKSAEVHSRVFANSL